MTTAQDQDYQGRLPGARGRRRRAVHQAERRPGAPTSSSRSSSRRACSRRFCAAGTSRKSPDIAARICGICPIAYQMSAVHAIERALGIHDRSRRAAAAPPVLLRRMDREPRSARLHAARARFPGLSRTPSRWLATTARVVEQGLRLKKIGNRIVTLMGGREIHPVSAAVGGFYKVPTKEPNCARWRRI